MRTTLSASQLGSTQVHDFWGRVEAGGLTPTGRISPSSRYHVTDDSDGAAVGVSGGRHRLKTTHFGNAVYRDMHTTLRIDAIRFRDEGMHVGLERPVNDRDAAATVRLGPFPRYPEGAPRLLFGAWHGVTPLEEQNMLYRLCFMDGGRTLVGVLQRDGFNIPLVGTGTTAQIPSQTTVAVSAVHTSQGSAVWLTGFSTGSVTANVPRGLVKVLDADGKPLFLTALNAMNSLPDPSDNASRILALFGQSQFGHNDQPALVYRDGYPPEGFDAASWQRDDLAKLTLVDGKFRLTEATLNGHPRGMETRATNLDAYRFVALPDGRFYKIIPNSVIKYDTQGRVTQVFVTRNTQDYYYDEIQHTRRAERLEISYQDDGKVVLTFTPVNLGPLDDDPENPRQITTEVGQIDSPAEIQ